MKTAILLLSALLLTACATHDNRDRYVLGAANQRNASLQSSRDVALPNDKAVEDTSGQRAAEAVKALNERKPTSLKQVSDTEGTQ